MSRGHLRRFVVRRYAQPAVQGGLYFRRFHGKSGIVKGMQGKCYKVEVKDHDATKIIVVHPVHLKKIVVA